MTKTLTEQWRDGTLPVGNYYCKLYYNGFKEKIQECVKSRYDSKSCIPMSCGNKDEEVLAPVPSYEEVKHWDEFANKIMDEVEKLKAQLNEANEIIANFRTYDFTINDENAEEYQVKYGIVGEKIYTNKKPSKEFERWRKKITKSFEKKLKSGV